MHSQNVEARKGGTISRSYLVDSLFAFWLGKKLEIHPKSSFFFQKMSWSTYCVMRSLLYTTKHIGGADEYLARLIFCQ